MSGWICPSSWWDVTSVDSPAGPAERRKFESSSSGLAPATFLTLAPDGLVDAAEEGLCDEEATARHLAPLQTFEPMYQVLVLACGAGLMCIRTLLPGIRLVPGLDTLGPGVGDRLACLACGDCGFDSDGCSRTLVLQRQVERLAAGYASRGPVRLEEQ